MQVDDIGLLELGQGGDVRPRVGDVHGKQVFPAEAVGHPDDHTLPHELPHQPPTLAEGHDGDLVRFFVTHQHLGLDAMILQRFQQAAGGNGRTSHTFGGIYQQDSHNKATICREEHQRCTRCAIMTHLPRFFGKSTLFPAESLPFKLQNRPATSVLSGGKPSPKNRNGGDSSGHMPGGRRGSLRRE